jgi:hypothetical protein
MKEKTFLLYIFIILCILILIYYLQKDVNIFSIKKEGFIGRYYRPIYRNFRKNVGSSLSQYVKNWSISYKKFIS